MVYDIRRGFPNLSQAKILAVDTETDGVQWQICKVVGYVITWGPRPDESGYWPVRHQPGGNVDDPEAVERWVRDLMAREEILKIGHAFKFDLHMMANHGIHVRGPMSCTMVTEALIDENAGSYSLDASAKRHPGVPVKLGDKLYAKIHERFKHEGCPEGRQSMRFFWRMPGDDPEVVDYSAGDGTSTWGLHFAQMEEIREQNLERVYGVECRALPTLFRAERKGVFVDEERLHGLNQSIIKKIEKTQKVFNKIQPEFNPRSASHVQKLMHKYKKDWQYGQVTERMRDRGVLQGNPSFVEKWLKNYKEGRDLIQFRRLTNLKNSFIDPLFEEHLFRGRVHTTFNQLKMDDYGVVTGRLSSSDPNMQQVPKRDKELAPLFRCIFRPDKGFIWSSNDYRQQEYVMFADYTQAKLLCDGYRKEPPIDVHQIIADVCQVERDPTAKRINLGKLYGMGLPKLATDLGISLAEAKRIDKLYQQMVPESREFLRACEKAAKIRGWVKSKLGRRRRFSYDLAHKAGNAVIQMSSADMTKLKMVEIDEYFQKNGGAELLLQVHDELSWQFQDPEADKRAGEIMRSFGPDDAFQMSLPVRTDSKHGADWAEATFGIKFNGFK